MVRRLLAVSLLLMFSVGSAFAMDIDRHGDYTAKDASGVVARKCKNFSGTDDNRGNCTDWCSGYTATNAGATCACDEGTCADEPAAPLAAAAPASAH